MKERPTFVCQNCGHEEPKWLGRCPECGSWNAFSLAEPERREAKSRKTGSSIPLVSIKTKEMGRLDAGNEEINRVLGGGVMRGSSVLIGGEPGIGKSTLMLQLASTFVSGGRILYVTGEESAAQIRMRADRLKITQDRIEVLSETDLGVILHVMDQVKPILVIVDSIQTVYSPELSSIPGTVSQVKFCAQELNDRIKERGLCLLLIGHVTKEGVIAGPKVIEHLVDTVLYFDQSGTDIRILRASKNRFGSTDEIGIFQMTAAGLNPVRDPTLLFLEHREGDLPSGVTISPVYEGSRILLVEIQSLVVPAKGGISRIFSERIDARRVSRIAAVLEKHLKIPFSELDIYVNVAGGIRIDEVAIDLALACSLYSAKTGLALPASTAVVGEVSLAGEIRGVSHIERRLKSTQEMGFRRLIGPSRKEDGASPLYHEAGSLQDAIRTAFGGGPRSP